ncbi:MAG TPA: hypothetical protein ENI46_03540 [Firmicutes bacterium]|nr:hypothetical protein [Bacillota bacterium]
MKRLILVAVLAAMVTSGCSSRAVSLKSMMGFEHVDVYYLVGDRWVPEDSLSWFDRSWYRELRFDTDGDGEWNYLYAEVYDDVAGWTWIPSSARINPQQEPELARTKRYLVRDRDAPPVQPSLDDFGYERR